jgi:hypothetical protein
MESFITCSFEDIFRELLTNHGGSDKCIKKLVEKPEGMRSLGRPRHGWKDNIRMHLKR